MAEAQPTAAERFGVILRTWHGGRMTDEQMVARVGTFEEASRISQKLTADRVRLNNSDVTVSIEGIKERQ